MSKIHITSKVEMHKHANIRNVLRYCVKSLKDIKNFYKINAEAKFTTSDLCLSIRTNNILTCGIR